MSDERPDATSDTDERDEQIQSLSQAFEMFTKTTASLEASYSLLEERVKSLDAELQAKNEELATTTEYLNSILDSMSDGVVVVDRDNKVTTVNRAAGEVLGLDPDEAETKHPEALLGRLPSELSTLNEIELPGKNGALIPVTAKTSPVTDDSGNDNGTVTVFQDLRELESLRRQVRQRDRLAAIGEMAATVAHEIRNPLGGIQGFASLLMRDLDEGSDGHRLVEKIVTGTKNLNRIVSNLLEYTRPVELDVDECDARELVESAIGYCTHGEHVTIRNAVPEGLRLRADDHQIRQVLLNVLLNGAQSIEDVGTIDVAGSETDDSILISVRDSGCGIAAEDLEQVFMPFFTTKEKGTGLGLAAALKTIEAHGGSIRVTSEVDQGTTFEIVLPRGM